RPRHRAPDLLWLGFMRSYTRLVSAALRVSTAAAVLACGGTATDSNSVTNVGTGGGTPTLTSITVTLPSPSLTVGQTETASASGLDQNSAAIATGTVTWTSSTPAVATVSQTGLVTAVSAGTTQIVATAGGKTGQATLAVTVVTPSPVASVTVAPTTFTLVIGTTQQMTA